jgi:hypothetical protein
MLIYYVKPARFYIRINNLYGMYKEYIISTTNYKGIYDLTTDLNNARPGEKLVSAQFMVNEFGGESNDFYQHCINILSNFFISYTYE